MQTIHQFSVEGILGNTIDFKEFEGKKILVVNVASACGFTNQYAQLEELYKTFEDRVMIIGFPCNDFGNQEPGSEQEIKRFCSINYGITFPLARKISIIGANQHPLYKWLTHKSENGTMDATVEWNFYKFAVSPKGQLEHVFSSSLNPLSEEILSWIESD